MKALLHSCLALLCLLVALTARAQSPNTVLVVANANNAQSVALANYYMNQRSIPKRNLLLLNWDANDNADTCTLKQFKTKIFNQVNKKIAESKPIDYIVLCRNLPIRISDTDGSVDSALAGKTTSKRNNPFYGKADKFDSKTYGIYLVTRLDGWAWSDAFSLVNRSLAAKPGDLFVFDCDPSKDSLNTYRNFNLYMQQANKILVNAGMSTLLDDTSAFICPVQQMASYVSWGSNDANFNADEYKHLIFLPGAIAETAVSTSASNLRYPGGSQSQIAALIRQGVTGVKGYVSEPLITAAARADVLIPGYASGRNLADSFYAASRYLGWKDVIIGDPLCAPYKK